MIDIFAYIALGLVLIVSLVQGVALAWGYVIFHGWPFPPLYRWIQTHIDYDAWAVWLLATFTLVATMIAVMTAW